MVASTSTTLVGLVALAVLAALGGYTASFACLVIERRPLGRPATGRSVCVCGSPIPMYRNIPVVTWLAQRGRAACCGAPIPTWYLVAELGTAAAAVGGALLVARSPLTGALTGIVLAIVATVVARRLQSVKAPMVVAVNEVDD